MSSTELVQEHETANQDDQRNPEVDVGGDGARKIAGTLDFSGRHRSLGMELGEPGVPS